jgi:hypothetical protein
MERVEEGRRLLRVAPPALIHHQQPEVPLIRAADGVRGVAIVTGGQLLLALGLTDAGPMNALPELLLDPMVTLSTRCRDICFVDR